MVDSTQEVIRQEGLERADSGGKMGGLRRADLGGKLAGFERADLGARWGGGFMRADLI